MLARLGKIAVVAALACTLGLHWAFLQSLAWAGMVVSYSRAAPLSQALEKTFDGKHPCPLCQAIAKAKRAEKKPDTQLAKRIEGITAWTRFVLTPTRRFWRLLPDQPAPRSIFSPPPSPPPRAGLA
jgi:hypothetical protein